MNFLLSILLILVGSWLIYYSRQLEKWIGRWQWAEEYLGWTAQWYVIIWFLLIVLWFLVLFWVVNIK